MQPNSIIEMRDAIMRKEIRNRVRVVMKNYSVRAECGRDQFRIVFYYKKIARLID